MFYLVNWTSTLPQQQALAELESQASVCVRVLLMNIIHLQHKVWTIIDIQQILMVEDKLTTKTTPKRSTYG